MSFAFLGVAWKFLKGLPWQLYAFLALVAACWWYGHVRYEAGQASVQAAWDAATAEARDKAKAREKEWGDAVYKLSYEWETWRIGYEAETTRTIDALRSGAIRVRPRLQCSVPQASGPAAVHDGPTPGPEQPTGLQESDVELVLRIGADADTVGARLTACQAYVKSLTSGSN